MVASSPVVKKEFCPAKNLSLAAQELWQLVGHLRQQKKWRTPSTPNYFLLIQYLWHCNASACVSLGNRRKPTNKSFPPHGDNTHSKVSQNRSTFIRPKKKFVSISSTIRKTWIGLISKIFGILYRVLKIRKVIIPLKLEGTEIEEQAKTKWAAKKAEGFWIKKKKPVLSSELQVKYWL